MTLRKRLPVSPPSKVGSPPSKVGSPSSKVGLPSRRPNPADLKLRVPASRPKSRVDSSLSKTPDLLLSVLDDLVQTDQHPVRLAGTVAVAIKDDTGQFHGWWVTFGSSGPVCGRGSALPANTNAVVIMGQAEAQSILRNGILPKRPELLEQAGDLKLLRRFFERYCQRFNMLGVRSAHRAPSRIAPARSRSRTRV